MRSVPVPVRRSGVSPRAKGRGAIAVLLLALALTQTGGALPGSAQSPPGPPMQLVPRAPAAGDGATRAPANAPVVAPGTLSPLAPERSQPVGTGVSERLDINALTIGDPLRPSVRHKARRFKFRLDARVLAKKVFRANEIDGKGSGYFLLTPDGRLRTLAVTPEKLQRVSARKEVQRLAAHIRRRDRLRLRREARVKRMLGIGHRAAARPRQLSDFFTDNSLSAGDVVVTGSGLQVFRGAQHYPYMAKDFQPLSQWLKAGKSVRNRSTVQGRGLQEIQRQLDRGR